MNLQPGHILKQRYEIIRVLGSGNFGKTYQAKDLSSGVQCAVKHFQPDPTIPYQVALDRFFREGAILQKLGHHDKISKYWDDFEEDQNFYLVQEFIDGHDLSKEIVSGNNWPEEQVVTFLKDVLQILAFVHGQKHIHRDIKPSNLMRRGYDQKIVLIDFGVVKENATTAGGTVIPNQQTIVVSSLGYTPPEQRSGKPEFNSDIYALGMTAIQALTGISPEYLSRHPKKGNIVWTNPRMASPSLKKILDKMVCLESKDRYLSAADVLMDLEKLSPSSAVNSNNQSLKISQVTGMISSDQNKVVCFVLSVVFGVLVIFLGWRILKAIQIKQSWDEAQELSAKEEYKDAISALNKTLELKPDFPEALASRGYAWSQLMPQKDDFFISSIESDCNQALKIQPDFPPALNCRGQAKVHGNQNDNDINEGIADYDKVIRLNPKEKQVIADAWYNKGEALLKLKADVEANRKEARKAFNEAIQINRSFPAAWREIARLEKDMNLCESALSSYNRAIDLALKSEEKDKLINERKELKCQ